MTVLKRVILDLLKDQRLQLGMNLLQLSDQKQVLREEEWDELVSTVLLHLTEHKMDARDETETLVKMIKKEQNKVCYGRLVMDLSMREDQLKG